MTRTSTLRVTSSPTRSYSPPAAPARVWAAVRGEIADLVEKDRPAVGDLETAGPVSHRASERTAHVAEELALEHLARDGTAVHSNKRLVRAPATLVDFVREQFLAGAGFAK